MLANARNLPPALQAGSTGDTSSWLRLRNTLNPAARSKGSYLGFGNIGRHLVELLRPFAMQVEALRRSMAPPKAFAMITREQLPQSLAKADHVVNVLPASSSSTGFLSFAQFAAMKKGRCPLQHWPRGNCGSGRRFWPR